MSNMTSKQSLKSGRIDPYVLTRNFTDLHPPLDPHEASIAADRCYFCYDAPCIQACPTEIDIPLFIRQISTGMPKASAKTIFDQNILGGMCARVCPTETLCEQACVREKSEGKPVEIGRLQRFATDNLMDTGTHPFTRAALTHKHIAVIGAGPAGLSAAHRLAMLGHEVTIFDANPKAGGLNEFGIAAYKTTHDFAQREIDWLLQIGGISIKHSQILGQDFTLGEVNCDYDAVFLGMGLGDVRHLGIEGEGLDNIENAVDFIARLRQSKNLSQLETGARVVIIGGGMTAIDAAVQAKLLGAPDVTIIYRGSAEKMPASQFEQELAKVKNVRVIYNTQPIAFHGTQKVEAIECSTDTHNGTSIQLPADHVLLAIGQILARLPARLETQDNKIKINDRYRTSMTGVWAGGDCVAIGDDLTVTAVAQGRDAAMDIHAMLTGV